MPDKKVVPVRFYPKADADLIEWLEGLAAGEGNNTIKAMLRAGIAVTQNSNKHPAPSIADTFAEALDPQSLRAALESFLPRIREIVDASLASANFTQTRREVASQDENMVSSNLLKGHLLSDSDDE